MTVTEPKRSIQRMPAVYVSCSAVVLGGWLAPLMASVGPRDMLDILKSLKKRVTLEHIEGDGALEDLGMSPSQIEAIKKDRPVSRNPVFRRRLDDFKAQIRDGDELWYYESVRESFWGTGGYAIVRSGKVIDSITAWKS